MIWPLSMVTSLFTPASISPPPRMDSAADATHDTASTSFRLPDFTAFLNKLTDAATAAWPTEPPKPYKRAKVLLMIWENDDLEIETEMKPLADVFQGQYRFDTEIWKIPLRRSGAELSRKIASVVRTEGREENLLVFYYGGHARANDHIAGRPIWFANQSTNSPFVRSSLLHTEIERSDCDVLLLYDCPHAVRPGERYTGKGMIETLAALPLGTSTAAIRNPGSFTASLVQELSHVAKSSDGLSVVDLHRRLIARQQPLSHDICLTDSSFSVVKLDRHTGVPVLEPSLQHLPMHALLSASKAPSRAIILTPLQDGNSASPAHPDEVSGPAGATSKIDYLSAPHDTSVLLAVRLGEQSIDPEKWSTWLALAPEKAKEITIKAAYPSFSLMLLVQMPLQVWDLLPASAAMTFVGFVSGRCVKEDLNKTLDAERAEWGRTKVIGTNCMRDGHIPGVEQGLCSGARSSEKARASIWPAVFTRGRPEVYSAEGVPFYLALEGVLAESESTQERSILEAFIQDGRDPYIMEKYIGDEIQQFCGAANFNGKDNGDNSSSTTNAVVIERVQGMQEMKTLAQGQLLDTLTPTMDNSKSLIRTVDAVQEHSAKQRLIYVTDLEPSTMLALAATAPRNHTRFLREFFHGYLSSQAGIGVTVAPENTAFKLSFNLPVLALREGSAAPDARHLRSYTHASFLGDTDQQRHFFESHFSCMVAGVDETFFTAYAFYDTYYDGEKSKRSTRAFENNVTDFLTGQTPAADPKIFTAREYFLRTLQSAVRDAKDEWSNSGLAVLKKLKELTKPSSALPDTPTTFNIVQISERLQSGLNSVSRTWTRFQETDLAYFDVNSDPSEQRAILAAIDKDMRDLQDLQQSLQQETSIFQSRTASQRTLENEKHNHAISRLLIITPVASSIIILAARFSMLRFVVLTAVAACAAAVGAGKRPYITAMSIGISAERAEVLKDYVRDFGTINRDIKAHVRGAWEGSLSKTVGVRRKVLVEEAKVLGTG